MTIGGTGSPLKAAAKLNFLEDIKALV